MHGTPNPELIGKTGSHGCFRLTNWDAVRLGKMVEAGVRVRFTDQPTMLAQR
jgi:lipoprotein-anchoring transpeptidase ErfK/SrfK